MEILEISHLTFLYPGEDCPALEDISFTLSEGGFLVMTGPSGSGKSTLLRQLKPQLRPSGKAMGQVTFMGVPLEELDSRRSAAEIGFVQQQVEAQIVTDKVWHELAFGLESLGEDSNSIRRKIAETAGFFGIESWLGQDTASLSGGQKQLLNLASVMVMEPRLLILDEPASQLDPIAAASFLDMVARINREKGTTVIISEHRLEALLPLATGLMVMDEGKIAHLGAVRETLAAVKGSRAFLDMPAPIRIWSAVETDLPCPMTAMEGREWLDKFAESKHLKPVSPLPEPKRGDEAVRLTDVWFSYEKNGANILRGLDLKANFGEITCLLGGNGAGKSTALSIAAGILKPYSGKVRIKDKTGMLPQEPMTMFLKETLLEDLELACGDPVELEKAVKLCQLEGLLHRHPYDLSGGEMQRAALCKLLLTKPKILLLDEPTKGMDMAFRKVFGGILRELARDGLCILLVSHDMDFCAEFAHRCLLVFDGVCAAQGTATEFFSQGSFYTTSASLMARRLLPEAITAEQVIEACGGGPVAPVKEEKHPKMRPAEEGEPAFASKVSDRTKITKEEGSPGRGSVRWAVFLLLLLIPVTIWLGNRFFGSRKYLVLSLLVMAEVFVPFLLHFEGRRPKAAELAVTATLCAIAIAGRAAFFALPFFKPMLAVVIVSAAALGPETGFVVGAVTMLVSNMMYGQGPWTPWQMLALGACGLAAGLVFYTAKVSKKRIWLCLFGLVSAVVIYGGIMNPASVLMYQSQPSLQMVLAAYVTGLPTDLTHAAATVLLLWLLGPAMLRRLERIKVKYF